MSSVSTVVLHFVDRRPELVRVDGNDEDLLKEELRTRWSGRKGSSLGFEEEGSMIGGSDFLGLQPAETHHLKATSEVGVPGCRGL